MRELDLIVGEKDKFLELLTFAVSNGWSTVDSRTVTNVRGKLVYSILLVKENKTEEDEK